MSFHLCSRCGGTGQVELPPGYPRFHTVYDKCPQCRGTGQVFHQSKNPNHNQQKGNMPKKKQEDLPAMEGPGVAPQVFKDVEAAADKYIDVRDKRMALTTKEVEARAVLAEKMASHSLNIYRFDDHQVEVIPGKLKVKVKNLGQDGDTSDD